MRIEVTKLKDGTGFVVAQNQCWVDGVYETEAAARKACKVSPDKLHEVWQRVLEKDRDNGVITEAML